MSLVLCPECGSKISDKACVCPHCGYYCDNPALPISSQESFEIVPVNVEIEVWGQDENDELAVIASEDKKTLAKFLTKAEHFETMFPDVANYVKDHMALPETEYKAKLTPELRKLMDEGKLSFKLDKQNEIMAILQNGDKRIAKQIRLEEMQLDVNTAQSLNNLTTTAMLNQVLDEIRDVREAIEAIHLELQDDRLALAEAARDRLIQASKIQDPSLRTSALIGAVGDATNSKHQLMRNFGHNRLALDKEADKSVREMMRDKLGKGEALGTKADDAMEDLSLIAATVQVECAGWAMLGERDSACYCLEEFRKFIKDNKLDDTDTLIMINEHSPHNWIGMAKKFEGVSKRIESMSKTHALPPTSNANKLEGRE